MPSKNPKLRTYKERDFHHTSNHISQERWDDIFKPEKKVQNSDKKELDKSDE